MPSSDEVARWSGDQAKWPHTPPLDVFRALYEKDSNLVWRVDVGHLVNVLDMALEEIEANEVYEQERNG